MRQYLDLFRNRNFVLHWLAGAISNLGDFFNSLALVKILSEDPEQLGFYMALIMVAKVVPSAVLSPLAGIAADRFPRRTMMILSDLLRAFFVLGLVFVNQPLLIVGLCFLSAVAAAFYNPASSALLPSLVTKEQLITASSLNVMTQRMAMLLGNGIGAVVLVSVGAHNVFYIDSATYAISALLLAGMSLPAAISALARSGSPWQKIKGDLAEAVSFVRATPPVRHLFTTLAIAGVADSAMNVLLITFFTLGLGLAAESLGYVWALFGGASVIGALVIGAVGRRVRWQSLLTYGTVYVWFATMGALVTASPIPSVAFLTVLGLGSGAINVSINAAIGELVPNHIRGRIFGSFSMLNSTIYVVGVLAAGTLSDLYGPVPTLMGFGTFYLAAGLYTIFAFRPRPAGVAREAAAGD